MEKIKIGLELRSLSNLMKRYFEFSTHKKEVEEITGNNGWIIGYLSRNRDKEIYQSDIERFFTITRSTVSRVLTLMEQKGFITREKVAGDGRKKKICLTEKAESVCFLMQKDIEKFEEQIIKGFDKKEIILLYDYIARMKDNIKGI